MPRQYLNVPYRSKDSAKALGARFDGSVKQWYVESGVDLTAFATWLPTDASAEAPDSFPITAAKSDPFAVAPTPKGISLTQLLRGVGEAVAAAYASGVWTQIEVSEATVRNGHVYLDVSERDSAGQLVAKARAMIWASTAANILPAFERATGAVLGPGIKLLVRARPVFKAQYGFSLEIDAIDASYTLGDLEARRNEIRLRLRQEGVFDQNRSLPLPWDYRLILVVAPEQAAGLGDFNKEAERLARFGVCRFVYAHSVFQGEGAAANIARAANAAMTELLRNEGGQGASIAPDAIVIIRGGGAVNDLAWLNDYDLARFICDQKIPVFTGIGHARDNTIADEVAHTSFDTPSKVIAGIEQQIQTRTRESKSLWETICAGSAQVARNARLQTERHESQVRSDAQQHLSRARQQIAASLNTVAHQAVREVHEASEVSLSLLNSIRQNAARDITIARQAIPTLMTDIHAKAWSSISEGRSRTAVDFNTVLTRGTAAHRAAKQSVEGQMQGIGERAAGSLRDARRSAQALVREVVSQGPEKTLTRGFAIVKDGDSDQLVTSSARAAQASTLTIRFRDGNVQAQAIAEKKEA
jgi:exodeoxyribonuclease VII large subunit